MSYFESADPCVLGLDSWSQVLPSTFSTINKKAQGKIAELNISSHCHQSSKTVGRMSETYEPQAFLGISVKPSPAKAPMCESHSDEKPPTQTLQRTISRKARRLRAAQRKREEILKSLPSTATEEDKRWALYPKAMKQRTDADLRKAARTNKHACYTATIAAMNIPKSRRLIFKMSQSAYAIFEKHYKGEEASQWVAPRSLLIELECLRRDVPTPTINFQHFPTSNISAIGQSIERAHRLGDPCPPQLGMPDYEPHSGFLETSANLPDSNDKVVASPLYTPQSGSLETCANLLDSYDKVVASPLYGQVLSLLKWENPFLSTAALLATSLALFIIKTCVMTFNFLFGCLFGVIFINKPPSYKYFPQSAMSPDDGAKFLGKVAPKVGNVPDKPANSPGVTTSSNGHMQVMSRVAPPKISKKDPNDGFLNGFGIGI